MNLSSNRRDWLSRMAPLPLAPLLASTYISAGPLRPPAKARPRLGINIAGVAYWTSELPFVDVFRTSSDWLLGPQGESGRAADARPDLDALGWVTLLPAGAWAEKQLAASSRIPVGLWTTLYKGQGRVEMRGQVQTLSSQPGRIQFRVTPHDAAALSLRLLQTDPADPARNIRVLMPGYEASQVALVKERLDWPQSIWPA